MSISTSLLFCFWFILFNKYLFYDRVYHFLKLYKTHESCLSVWTNIYILSSKFIQLQANADIPSFSYGLSLAFSLLFVLGQWIPQSLDGTFNSTGSGQTQFGQAQECDTTQTSVENTCGPQQFFGDFGDIVGCYIIHSGEVKRSRDCTMMV